MSVPEHEAAAEQEQAAAEEHASQYDPEAANYPSPCGEFCFSTWTNPTSEHARKAREHRRLAARHRRASEALREAEQEACEGIPERDRDISPFFHRDDISSVEVEDADDDAPSKFTVRFRPVPGVDADKMQTLVDCHTARNAVRGHEAPAMPYCPLVPGGVSASVRSMGDELEVVLEVDDPQSRDDVEKRVRALAERVGSARDRQASEGA